MLFVLSTFTEMDVPNQVLLNLVQHNTIMLNWFCGVCRPLRLQQVEGMVLTQLALYNEFVNHLPDKRNQALSKVFNNTLDTIVYGKVFRETCLRGTNYKYFKSWAKHEQPYSDFSDKEFNTLCRQVNECCCVFEKWEQIVKNLTDQRITEIDARSLSVSQLYKAKNIDWCLQLNDTLRSNSKKNGDPLYSPGKFNNIFQHIVASGIFDDIQHSPSLAANFGGRLQSAMITYCRCRYQPY